MDATVSACTQLLSTLQGYHCSLSSQTYCWDGTAFQREAKIHMKDHNGPSHCAAPCPRLDYRSDEALKLAPLAYRGLDVQKHRRMPAGLPDTCWTLAKAKVCLANPYPVATARTRQIALRWRLHVSCPSIVPDTLYKALEGYCSSFITHCVTSDFYDQILSSFTSFHHMHVLTGMHLAGMTYAAFQPPSRCVI